MEKRLVMHIERCVGCHTCEIECAIAHSASKNLATIVMSGEKPGYRVFVEAYMSRSIPVHCSHCQKAACMLACPTHAIHRDDEHGPVLFDRSRCIGCRMCVHACPFGVLTVDSSGRTVLKCDLCIERLAEGMEPACVAGCPTRAVTFELEDTTAHTKRRRSAAMILAAQEESIVD